MVYECSIKPRYSKVDLQLPVQRMLRILLLVEFSILYLVLFDINIQSHFCGAYSNQEIKYPEYSINYLADNSCAVHRYSQ
jgi:hypothetical protein